MSLRTLCAAFLLCCTFATFAGPGEDSLANQLKEYARFADSVNATLKYQTGKVTLPDGKVSLNVPVGFKFLNKEQSRFVLTDLWGNPKESVSDLEGMIFREESDPFAENSYAFIVSYENMGHVKDDDAADINYDEMMQQLQEEEKATNTERAKNGYETLHIIGWAQKPFYDAKNKVLHWAKEIKFGSSDEHTLNYEVRLLGRNGVLSLNAVSSMNELPAVKKDIPSILNIASFTEGNTYADFDPKVDEVAAWTIGGLVAGKVLLKAGFFAVILKFLAASWKFILLGLVAFGGVFKRFFSRKKKEELVPAVATNEPSPPANEPGQE